MCKVIFCFVCKKLQQLRYIYCCSRLSLTEAANLLDFSVSIKLFVTNDCGEWASNIATTKDSSEPLEQRNGNREKSERQTEEMIT